MTSVVEGLVEELWELEYGKLPRNVVAEAVKAIVDTLAVATAGYERSPTASLYASEIAPRLRDGATVLGGWWKTARHLAASANSFSAHSLEYDDWLREGYVHAGSVVVPTVIALSERFADWRTVVEAVVVGYEVAARIGYAAGREHYVLWHATGTAGAMGAAAAASRVLGLTPRAAANAISIAGYFATGVWGFVEAGSSIKPMSPAHASLMGCVAAKLAEKGTTTSTRVLEGDRGFCRAMAPKCRLEYVLSPPWDYAILRNGYKLYPCCRHTHSAIDAAIRLVNEDGVRGTDVEELEIRTFSEAASIAHIRLPRSLEEARFSLTFVTSVALVYGRVGLREMEEGLRDGRVLRLAREAKVTVDRDLDAEFPRKQPALVRVKVSGSWFERLVETPLGDPDNPVSLSSLIAKAGSLSASAFRLANHVVKEVGRGLSSKAPTLVELPKPAING